MEKRKSYSEQLKDSRWQQKRLQIFERDKFTCVRCPNGVKNGTELHIHHLEYHLNTNVWDYDNSLLETLCSPCHKNEHFPEQLIKPGSDLPFAWNEVEILRILLLHGDKSVNFSIGLQKYKKLYQFIICELARDDVRFESKELQEMYDVLASSHFNDPDNEPDITTFFNIEDPVKRAFARYCAETAEKKISPNWVEKGYKVKGVDADIADACFNLVIRFKISMIQRHINKKQDLMLLPQSDEALMETLKEIQELNNYKVKLNQLLSNRY